MSIVITKPGLYDIPFDVYLSDPVPAPGSLSSSGAKTLVNHSPARFAYERDHGRPPKLAFDVGHAAHGEVLGEGMKIAVIPDDVLAKDGGASTAKAKAFIEEARARGAVPIKSDQAAEVKAMADAIRAHPLAGKLLNPSLGAVEQSAFWRDEEHGIWCRARYDYLRTTGDRLLIVDYKSTVNARTPEFAKSVWNYGYAQQGSHYLDGARTLELGDNPAFLLVAQETTAPYLVGVFELAGPALRVGAERNARARALFAECSKTGEWPGYSQEIELLDLPFFAERQHEQEALLW